VERDVNGRKSRLIFEEAAAAFEPFDLGADIGELSLDFHRVRNFARLLHDLQELRLERPLRADARFQINIFLGHVLTRALFVQDAAANAANLSYRRLEILRGHANNYVDHCRSDSLRYCLILLGFRNDHEAAMFVSDGGDLSLAFIRIVGLDGHLGVLNYLAPDGLSGAG